jgi:hypothetical protein
MIGPARLAVCDVRGETYASPLELKGGRLRLVSPSVRYAAVEASAVDVRPVGIVVGRLAAMP